MDAGNEKLLAYVDDELAPDERADFERLLATDTGLAARVAAQRSLRDKVRSAYQDVLQEPVPERLRQLAESASGPAVVADFGSARARKVERAGQRWGSREWGAIAASLVAGVILAQWNPLAGRSALVEIRNGVLVARGELARSLSRQLASDRSSAANVAIGLSFRSHAGEYCRTFTTRDAAAIAGVACRAGDAWRLETLARTTVASGGDYRQAASAVPPAVLTAVSVAIAGEPLDAQSERAAMARDWR